ncbi:hypothetical protein EIP86_006345 [Pleurotus ostreatoroseus]|nr:hypothetical protein EIP86_006345 [Pleurotus ostreatoroseus]
MQKKRKEGEEKFLLGARRELERCGAEHAEAFGDVVEEMQAVYDQFTLDYARAEDAIRAKWAQLLAVQTKCLEADKAREKGQVRGMAAAKKAVEDFGTLVSSLTDPAATE